MSWTGGEFDFKEGTSVKEMYADAYEDLYENRGAMEPHMETIKLLTREPFKHREEAKAFIEQQYDYHRHCTGVRYLDYPETKSSKKMEDLKRRIAETQQKYTDYTNSHMVYDQKAAYIGCDKCGSKINREYLKGNNYCPVCHADMRSATVLNTLNGYLKKVKELSAQLKEETKKQAEKSKPTVMWYVYCSMYLG